MVSFVGDVCGVGCWCCWWFGCLRFLRCRSFALMVVSFVGVVSVVGCCVDGGVGCWRCL